ncbi:hypothetical protein EDF68_12017 [Ochrobactrum sp. BH3]|nr:hypothetical protein EDF68_12017 [Ochrobactrum sp. BH3]
MKPQCQGRPTPMVRMVGTMSQIGKYYEKTIVSAEVRKHAPTHAAHCKR